MARNIRWVAPALLLCWLGVTACGGDDDASTTDAPPTTTSIPEVSKTSPPKVLDGFVDAGGGRKLKVRCFGAGVPTVLLEVGGSGDLNDWPMTFVLDLLAAETTTCLYSRAGGRGSTPVEGWQKNVGPDRRRCVPPARTVTPTTECKAPTCSSVGRSAGLWRWPKHLSTPRRPPGS